MIVCIKKNCTPEKKLSFNPTAARLYGPTKECFALTFGKRFRQVELLCSITLVHISEKNMILRYFVLVITLLD